MPSTVMLVDAGSGIRDLVERHIDPATWTMVEREDVDVAWAEATVKAPDLVVLNADVAKGWNLCAQFKRRFPAVPVVLLSYKANKELFNNHQKLPTRADAYHHLPDELDGLGISLSYFCSHKSETQQDEESPRPRVRSGSRVAVPTGVVQKLESTVTSQSREIEGLKRQIEALEAERDAVSEKARRQMIELMAASPAPDVANELAAEKRRVLELTNELETARSAARSALERAQASEDARKSAEATATNALSEMVGMRARSRAAGNSAEQVAVLTAQLAQEHERRMAAESAKAQADERATTAERAWSGVNARAEELHQQLANRALEVERAVKEKSDVESALAMSRKLMKDYISEAARNAEAARASLERAREAEVAAAEAEAARAALQGELEFQKALVESLDDTQRKGGEQAKAQAAHVTELEAKLAETSAARAAAEEQLAAASARVKALEQDLVAAEAALTESSAALTAMQEAAAATKTQLEAELIGARTSHDAASHAARSEREAAETAARERFEAVRGWARRLERELENAEATRDAVLARLQSLVDDLRLVPIHHEPPPALIDPSS
ncbi:MAG: hypothetical protein U1F43_18590 [Myxococcota bacterium]